MDKQMAALVCAALMAVPLVFQSNEGPTLPNISGVEVILASRT